MCEGGIAVAFSFAPSAWMTRGCATRQQSAAVRPLAAAFEIEVEPIFAICEMWAGSSVRRGRDPDRRLSMPQTAPAGNGAVLSCFPFVLLARRRKRWRSHARKTGQLVPRAPGGTREPKSVSWIRNVAGSNGFDCRFCTRLVHPMGDDPRVAGSLRKQCECLAFSVTRGCQLPFLG